MENTTEAHQVHPALEPPRAARRRSRFWPISAGLLLGLVPVVGLLFWIYLFLHVGSILAVAATLPWVFGFLSVPILLVAVLNYWFKHRRTFALSILPTLLISFILFQTIFAFASAFTTILSTFTRPIFPASSSPSTLQADQTATDDFTQLSVTYHSVSKVTDANNIYIIVHVDIRNNSAGTDEDFSITQFRINNSLSKYSSSESIVNGSGRDVPNYHGNEFFDGGRPKPSIEAGQTFSGDLIFIVYNNEFLPNEFIWKPNDISGTTYTWPITIH